MKNLSYIVILLSAVTMSCKKSNTDADPSNSYFPNSVGNKYIYSVVDSVSHTTYNVKVAVVGKTTITVSNRIAVTIWTYTYPNSKDTNYVYSNKDTVIFYDHLKTNTTNSYQFPLNIGAKWRAAFFGDTSTVISNNTISVNGKTYDNAYLIHEQGDQYNYEIVRDQWYVPNIGMVKQNIAERQGRYQFWTLINYEIN